jgi:hypothetical protein
VWGKVGIVILDEFYDVKKNHFQNPHSTGEQVFDFYLFF